MASSSTCKPTILWIHGSWHTPAHFEPVMAVAQARGFANECPRQPSVGNLPPVGMMDDAACIRMTLQRLVEEEQRDILVVAHSYGGMLANEGIGARFSHKERASQGLAGGVRRIIFVAAFVVDVGAPLAGPFGGSMPPFIPQDADDMCHMEDPGERFYHDLSADEQKRWIAELRKSPMSTQLTPLTQVVYESHPCAYLYCTEDRGIPCVVQQGMVQDVTEKYGPVMTTDSLPSSHSPFLSMPEKTLDVLERQLGATGVASS